MLLTPVVAQNRDVMWKRMYFCCYMQHRNKYSAVFIAFVYIDTVGYFSAKMN